MPIICGILVFTRSSSSGILFVSESALNIMQLSLWGFSLRFETILTFPVGCLDWGVLLFNRSSWPALHFESGILLFPGSKVDPWPCIRVLSCFFLLFLSLFHECFCFVPLFLGEVAADADCFQMSRCIFKVFCIVHDFLLIGVWV